MRQQGGSQTATFDNHPDYPLVWSLPSLSTSNKENKSLSELLSEAISSFQDKRNKPLSLEFAKSFC